MNTIATTKAIELLHRAATQAGFVASVNNEDNYQRIWTRDSALCGLAALSTDDDLLKATYKASIETIFRHQHPAGFIPSNVSVDGQSVSYGSAVGRVDNHAWIIISACTYAHVQGERAWVKQFERGIEQSFTLMTAWEFNGRGLMYVPQSADWADEYYHHGYVLYNQLLRLWALRCAALIFEKDEYKREAVRVQAAIEKYFLQKEFYSVQVTRMAKDSPVPYFLMGFNTSSIYTQFDLQANALALLLNIGEEEDRSAAVSYLQQLASGSDGPVPSFYPAIEKGELLMEELKSNYAYRFRNGPHEFHNGGLWPVWNGLAALALRSGDHSLIQLLTEQSAAACSKREWEFNECFHGLTGEPIGVPHCAWSAAGLLLSVNHQFRHQLIT